MKLASQLALYSSQMLALNTYWPKGKNSRPFASETVVGVLLYCTIASMHSTSTGHCVHSHAFSRLQRRGANPWSFACIRQGMHLPRRQIKITTLELVSQISDHPPSFPRLLVDLVFSNVCFACRLGFDAFESFLLAN